MKIDDEVFQNMIESITKALPSFHSHKKKARVYVRQFLNKFTDVEREFIVKEILHHQNKSIINAIGNKKNIAIPFLGTFQYRESLELTRKIKNDVKLEFGVKDMREVDEETFEKIDTEVEKRKKNIILPLYFKQHGGRDSSVNPDFLKK